MVLFSGEVFVFSNCLFRSSSVLLKYFAKCQTKTDQVGLAAWVSFSAEHSCSLCADDNDEDDDDDDDDDDDEQRASRFGSTRSNAVPRPRPAP
jgi:hypothetical protein